MFLRLVLATTIYLRFALIFFLGFRHRVAIRARPIFRGIIITILLPITLLLFVLGVVVVTIINQEILCIYLLPVRTGLPNNHAEIRVQVFVHVWVVRV